MDRFHYQMALNVSVGRIPVDTRICSKYVAAVFTAVSLVLLVSGIKFSGYGTGISFALSVVSMVFLHMSTLSVSMVHPEHWNIRHVTSAGIHIYCTAANGCIAFIFAFIAIKSLDLWIDTSNGWALLTVLFNVFTLIHLRAWKRECLKISQKLQVNCKEKTWDIANNVIGLTNGKSFVQNMCATVDAIEYAGKHMSVMYDKNTHCYVPRFDKLC